MAKKQAACSHIILLNHPKQTTVVTLSVYAVYIDAAVESSDMKELDQKG